MDIKELKKIKLKRRFYLLCFILLIIVWCSYNFFKVKNYSKEYTVDDVLIKESYNKDQKSYIYQFNYENKDYTWAISKNYTWKRKLVKKIDILKNEKEACLIIKSNDLSFYPLCHIDDEQISYLLTSEEMKKNFNYNEDKQEEEKKYNDITIYNYLNHNYYIWNYRGFDHLSLNKNEKIELFNSDIYDPKLIVQTADFLFVPNYNSDYYFDKAYIIDEISGKVTTWDLKKQIYFDSKVLGIINNEIYLLDSHENIEYKINLVKKKIEKVGTKNKDGVFYDNGWIKLSLNKLKLKEEFNGLKALTYKNNNGLKAVINNQEIKLKNEDVTIIGMDNTKVYYLIKDVLYEYSFDRGEIKLLSKFEWNFNFQNMIYIF